MGDRFRSARIRFGQLFYRLCRGRDRKPAEEALPPVSRKLIDAHENDLTWLARELHDDITQRLCLLLVSLETLKEGGISLDEFRHGIGNAMQQVSTLSTDVQRLSRRLHPSKLKLLGLAAATAGLCREVADQHKVQIELRVDDIPRELSPEISLAVFRALQEALQNAVKHSGSQRFEVLLNHNSNEIRLTVRDSGRGFDAAQASKGRGLGLTGMKERVALVDGELSIQSQLEKGTTVDVRVPLRLTMKSAQGPNL